MAHRSGHTEFFDSATERFKNAEWTVSRLLRARGSDCRVILKSVGVMRAALGVMEEELQTLRDVSAPVLDLGELEHILDLDRKVMDSVAAKFRSQCVKVS